MTLLASDQSLGVLTRCGGGCRHDARRDLVEHLGNGPDLTAARQASSVGSERGADHGLGTPSPVGPADRLGVELAGRGSRTRRRLADVRKVALASAGESRRLCSFWVIREPRYVWDIDDRTVAIAAQDCYAGAAVPLVRRR